MTNTNVLPVSNVINVTLQATPSGLALKNVNSLALFTNDAPLNLAASPYGIYINAPQVITDYGTNSKTAAMANAIFSQVPNILSGDGRLVILPMLASVSATSGQNVGANISANLAAIIAVTNGNLRVTVDGVVYNLAALNFTGCVTLADIASIIQAALTTVAVTASATVITFVSKKVGSTSTVALATYAGGGTDLTAAGLLNTAASVSTGGANSSGETLLAAITRTSGLVGYVGVMSTLNLEDAVKTANSTGIQALDMLYFEHFGTPTDVLGICTTIQQAGNTKTRMQAYTAGQTLANLFKAGYASRLCSVDFTGSLTAATMNLKQLATVNPDPGITETLWVQAQTAGSDLYVSYDGVPSVVSTGGNDFSDNPYSDLALKFALTVAGFNYLRQTNTKVPQTEKGMNGLKAAYAAVMNQFIVNGCLAPGKWNSSQTFGDPEIFNDNVALYGFYIYSTPIAQQASTDRDARKAPLIQIAAKRAGAIHKSDVIVVVNA